MAVSLTRLVQDGLPNARVVFGPGNDPVSAGRLAEVGAQLFADHAPARAVGAVFTNDQATVELLLGAIIRSATVVSLPLPGRAGDLHDYVAFIRRTCTTYGLAEVVARDDLAQLLNGVGVPSRPHAELHARPLAAPRNEFGLIQFTSGSTSHPKPIQLGDAALGANVLAILDRVDPQPGDIAVSWLPLSHDMGLVGMLLTSLAAIGPQWVGRGDIVLLEPTSFMRRPGLWLEALASYRGSFTAAPDFAYGMVTQRPPRRNLDLSSVRCAIVGGEVIRHDTLTHFVNRFSPHGLEATALCPAYGLAELGVAATLTDPASRWHQRRVTRAALADGRVDPSRPDEPALTLVASGAPLVGYDVRCNRGAGGDDAHPATGEVEVRGPSIGANAASGASYADRDGWLRTGDIGFVDDGRLYVCGRNDDYIVAHGRNLYAPAIEAAVGAVPNVRSGRVGAVSLPDGTWVVVAEAAEASSADRGPVREEIRRAAVQAGTASPDDVIVVGRGALPFTASGKLQRHEVRARLLRGDIAASQLGSSEPAWRAWGLSSGMDDQST